MATLCPHIKRARKKERDKKSDRKTDRQTNRLKNWKRRNYVKLKQIDICTKIQRNIKKKKKNV
jgi:hypothetical protein